MLIALCVITNMGLAGAVMDNTWVYFLSGTLLIAKLSKMLDKIDRTICYADGEKVHTAHVIAGDLLLYASGMQKFSK